MISLRGKIYDYLAVKVDYVKGMVKDFPERVKIYVYFWSANLFNEDEKSKILSKDEQEIFHILVAKGLFLCKRGRPDI